MASSLNWAPEKKFPNIVRHPDKKDPKSDASLENYPCKDRGLSNSGPQL